MRKQTRYLIIISSGLMFPSIVLGQQKGTQKQRVPQRGATLPSRGGSTRQAQEEVVVPMIFPVLGKVDWTDTFNLEPMTGKRVHHGEDLMAPKMRPLVAVFDGTVQIATATSPTGHNRLTLVGENGYTAKYMHINIDTPGTTDGNGTSEYAFAAGLKTGDHVKAGQLLAWVGNSGNARGGDPHCHFELYGPQGCINPTLSLKMAQHIEAPLVTLPHPELSLHDGETRLDGVVVAVQDGAITLSLLSTTQSEGNSASILAPKRITLTTAEAKHFLASSLKTQEDHSLLREGTSLIAFGKEAGQEDTFVAKRLYYDDVSSTLTPLPTFSTKKVDPLPAKPEPAPAPLEPAKPETIVFTPHKKATKFRVGETEQKLLERLNRERKEKGLPELTLSIPLSKAALAHTKFMQETNSLSHLGKDSSLPEDRVRKSGYQALTVRENIVMGIAEPDAILDQWVQKERIYLLNLLSPDVREIGLGYVPADTSNKREAYWTVLFANPTP